MEHRQKNETKPIWCQSWWNETFLKVTWFNQINYLKNEKTKKKLFNIKRSVVEHRQKIIQNRYFMSKLMKWNLLKFF